LDTNAVELQSKVAKSLCALSAEGLISMGALKEIGPKAQSPTYADMAEEIVRDMRGLNGALPGVVSEESKAFVESVR
jgi:hypothetical protein